MYRIHADVPTTRRQLLHHIFDEHDKLLWSGKRLTDLFEWLYENAEMEVELPTENHIMHITITRLLA